MHGPRLADAIRAIGGLVLHGRIPPTIEMEHVVGGGEVQSNAAGLERKDEDGRGAVASLESVDHRLTLERRRPAVQEHCLAVEVVADHRRQQVTHLAKLGKHQGLVARRHQLFEHFDEARALAGTGRKRPMISALGR